MHELTDEEILDIACAEESIAFKDSDGVMDGVFSVFKQNTETSAEILDFARRLIAADRAKRPGASEAEVALLNILASVSEEYQKYGGDDCPLCDYNGTWSLDVNKVRMDAFEAALPDLLKRKSHG